MENSTNQISALLMEAPLAAAAGEGGGVCEGIVNCSVVDSRRKCLKHILLIVKGCRISHRSLNDAFVG